MSTRRSEISIGDLVRVLAELPTTTLSEQLCIVGCLGLQVDVPQIQDYRKTQRVRNSKRREVKTPSSKPVMPDSPKMQDTPSSPVSTNKPVMPASPIDFPGKALSIRIKKLSSALELESVPSLPTEIDSQTPLQTEVSSVRPAIRIPLFSRRTERGLLAAAVAQPVRGLDLDVSHLIQVLVRGQPLRSLPLLPRFSTQSGCQLLLDFREALVPWWDDFHDLIGQFHAVLGEAACPVYEFADNPLDAVRWTEAGEQAWRIVFNKPVVIATDFGLVRTNRHELHSSLSDWRDFALYCRRQKTPVIALTPLERGRCPKELGNLMSIIEWNPKTKASDIKRLIGRLWRIQQ